MKTALVSIKFWLAVLATLIFGLGVSVKAAGLPNLVITSPATDEQISGTSVSVHLSVSNFILTDYKLHPKSVRGQGHLHLWLDQATNDAMSAIKIINDSYVFENVKPGMHTLVVELANNDHSPLVPPVRKIVTFTTSNTAVTSSTSLFSSPFIVAVSAFLFIVIVLFFVTNQTKSGSKSHTSTRKSSAKSSKK